MSVLQLRGGRSLIKIMIQQKLKSEWGVWIVYVADYRNASQDYKQNTELLFTVSSLNELAFVWNKTKISAFQHYFTNFKQSNVLKFVDNQDSKSSKKADALCFFRVPNQPSWEYGNNSNGGQFCFFFNKDEVLELRNAYEALVFSIVGDLFKISEDIVGVRFVDRAKNGESQVKVEIWVNFDNDQGDKIKIFGEELLDLMNSVKLTMSKAEFKNHKEKK